MYTKLDSVKKCGKGFERRKSEIVKHEYRNPKQIQMSKIQNSKQKRQAW